MSSPIHRSPSAARRVARLAALAAFAALAGAADAETAPSAEPVLTPALAPTIEPAAAPMMTPAVGPLTATASATPTVESAAIAPSMPAAAPAAPSAAAPTVAAPAASASRTDAGAPPVIGAPPLEADPRLRPLVPHEADDPRATDDERLQRRLAERVHDLDDRIATIGGARSQPIGAADAAVAGPTLDAPRQRRDDAYADFRRAAQDQASRARGAADPLDAAGAQAQERARAPIAAVNQLAVAECYKELACAPDGEADDLGRGTRALEAVDAAQLPESELPRLYYLRTWFFAERARRAEGPDHAAERGDAAARARATADELKARFPLSELTRAAKALTIGLDDAPPGAAP